MPSPASAAPEYDAPTRQCDVVMKGGITSGIVYPPLMLELARTYRFRSIGGTSAGAIAAAVTAAAEYGRERGGFAKLRALNDWLGAGTNLLSLFQPTREARPLLTLLLALQRRGSPRPAGGLAAIVARFWALFPGSVRVLLDVLPGALRDAMPVRYWAWTVIGGIVGGTLDVVLSRGLAGPEHPTGRAVLAIVLPVMFVGCWLGSVGACVARAWRLLTVVVPTQGFGVCTGLTTSGRVGAPGLTDWLHARIQDLAGLAPDAPPLTLGALRGKCAADGTAAGIELNMVTTSLGLGRSVMLPIADDAFLVRADEMRRLFPAPVVAHLLAHPGRADAAPAGYHWLPAPDAMPVLVLARMSLSFPVLLSAVPLHAPAAAEGGAPRCVWFSDGGLTSNFPIHFFDAWLPSRPTFGVNLTSMGPAGGRAGLAPVSLPAPQQPEGVSVSEIDSLPAFLGAIWATTQNFRDNTLAALPGYRDRIVQIALAGDEGGLNLAMGPDVVHHVMSKGDEAGELLRAFDFDRHRWVRFLSFMAQFERRVLAMGDTLHGAGYDQLLADGVREDFPYYRDVAWRAEALARVELLRDYVARVEARERERTGGAGDGRAFFEIDAPQPAGVLRVTPRE